MRSHTAARDVCSLYAPPDPSPPAVTLGALFHSQFQATDSAITVVGGKISSWPNRGPDAAPAIQGTAANRPLLNATTFNGGPCAAFDGISAELDCTFNTTIAATARPYLWVVMKPTTTAAGYPIALVDTRPLTSKWLGAPKWNASDVIMRSDRHLSDGNDVPSAGTLTSGQIGLGQAGCGASGVNTLVWNGVASANATKVGPIGAVVHMLQLGVISSPGVQFAIVSIAEVIVASDQPTTQQVADVVRYLKSPARNNGLGYGLP